MDPKSRNRLADKHTYQEMIDTFDTCRAKRWQCSVSDLLMLPLAIVFAVAAGKTVYFESLSLFDSVFGIEWMEAILSSIEPVFPSSFRGMESAIGCTLAVPSLCVLLFLSTLLGVARTRLSLGFAILIPFGNLICATRNPAYDHDSVINLCDVCVEWSTW
ncbi:MAG: hypothetical protein AAGG48_23750 [Planctomycetota bacterium]